MKPRTILLPAIILLLTACREPPYSTLISDNASLPVKQLPDYQCQGEIPEPLKEKLKDYRLAQEEDFVTSIREYAKETSVKLTCSIFTADFNGDGAKDYAMLLVNKNLSEDNSKGRNAFRFQLLINRGNGNFGTAAVRNYTKANQATDGVVYTSMRLKPAKEKEHSHQRFPFKPGTVEWESFIKNPAIELWRALPMTPNREPQDLNISTLAFCSEFFYFVEENPKTASEPTSKFTQEKSTTSESESQDSSVNVNRRLQNFSVCN